MEAQVKTAIKVINSAIKFDSQAIEILDVAVSKLISKADYKIDDLLEPTESRSYSPAAPQNYRQAINVISNAIAYSNDEEVLTAIFNSLQKIESRIPRALKLLEKKVEKVREEISFLLADVREMNDLNEIFALVESKVNY